MTEEVQLPETEGVDPFLDAYLEPFRAWLGQADVTELLVNRPGEVWVEQRGQMTRHDAPKVDNSLLQRLAEQVARVSNQGINRERPLLAAMLPNGARVQFVAPTATRAHWALAIRRHCLLDLPLDAYASGPLTPVQTTPSRSAEEDPVGFLREAVKDRKTILISGGTSTGKTTFLNALMREVPVDERVIVVEDTAEVQLHGPNDLGLIAVKGELGEALINTDDLLQAALPPAPGSNPVGRASRQGGGELPACGQYRSSGLVQHYPCQLDQRRAGATCADGGAVRPRPLAQRNDRLCALGDRRRSSSSAAKVRSGRSSRLSSFRRQSACLRRSES